MAPTSNLNPIVLFVSRVLLASWGYEAFFAIGLSSRTPTPGAGRP